MSCKKKKKKPADAVTSGLGDEVVPLTCVSSARNISLDEKAGKGGGGGWGVEFEYNVIEPGMSVALTAASIIVSGHQRTPKVPLKGPPIAGVPLECLRAPRQKNARAPERKRQESGRGQETCQVTEGVQPKSKSQVYVM